MDLRIYHCRALDDESSEGAANAAHIHGRNHRGTEPQSAARRWAARSAAAAGERSGENESHSILSDSFSPDLSPPARWPATPANPSTRSAFTGALRAPS